MSLRPPEKVRKLQEALHAKAKASAQYRFYTLYDKVHRPDVLAFAYHCCRHNGGAAGVDGQTFADVEAYGLEKWLAELAEDLRKKTYQPDAVRRVWIPKNDGKQRPLGIATIRDRVAQMAALLVLEPIFETDLQEEQYGYRRGRSALDAIQQVQQHLDDGCTEVVDADLSSYFDTIPHAELLQSLARRIGDGAVLRLVKAWLEAAVEETDDRGHRQRTTANKDQRRGCPQGGVISPLLSNVYMRRFVLGWKKLGHQQRLRAKLVNYADDFVVCCRGKASEVLQAVREMMERLRLQVNEAKTRCCVVGDEPFDFLGYTFGRCYSRRNGKAYLSPRPSKRKVGSLCREVSEQTRRSTTWQDEGRVVRKLNQTLRGWLNYFCLGPVTQAYETVMQHTRRRLRRWLCVKHRVRVGGYARFPREYLHEELGLMDLTKQGVRSLWAKA